MTTDTRVKRRAIRSLGAVLASLLVVTGCAMEAEELPVTGALIIGTTDEIGALDPAGRADRGALLVMNNVYPHLLTTLPGSTEPVPDIAVSAEFTSPTEYTVVLKTGLKFANGHALTASDVKFSIERHGEIAVDGGSSALFERVTEIEVVDDTTVVFTLSQEHDELWPSILSSPAAAIVDEEVFSRNSITDNLGIIRGQPFAGQYTIETFRERDLVQFKANSGYNGALGKPLSSTINLRHFGNAMNLARAIRAGDVDIAAQGFSPETIASFVDEENFVVHTTAGAEIRFLAVDPAAGPFGSATAEGDPDKALVVRQAMADLIDRPSIVAELYAGLYEPLYSFAPSGVRQGDELAALYGAAEGAPDPQSATIRFREAGITPPVALTIHYSAEEYGVLAVEELDAISRQLMQGGLFTVQVAAEDRETFDSGRANAGFPVFTSSYSPLVFDAEAYLSALFGAQSVIAERFSNAEIRALITTPTGGDTGATRSRMISEAMDLLAEQLPIIPLLQANEVLVASAEVTGIETARDASLVLRFSSLSK